MGTGANLQIESADLNLKLSAVDEEKVANIVEVCNVSRDEAVRVLDACHMDETMAIERFLSGNEIFTWSRVSKKKKPATYPRSGALPRVGHGYSRSFEREGDRDRDRDRDRDKGRRENDRSCCHDTHCPTGFRRGSRNYSTRVKAKDGLALKKHPSQSGELRLENGSKALAEPSTQTWTSPGHTQTWPGESNPKDSMWGERPTGKPDPWPETNHMDAATDSAENAWEDATHSVVSKQHWTLRVPGEEIASIPALDDRECDDVRLLPSSIQKSNQKQAVLLPTSVKRKFNYAAVAAAGTSHAKQIPVTTEAQPAPVPASLLTLPTEADSILCNTADGSQAVEPSVTKKQSFTTEGQGSTHTEQEDPSRVPSEDEAPSRAEALPGDDFLSTVSAPEESVNVHRDPNGAIPQGWGSHGPVPTTNGDNDIDEDTDDVSVHAERSAGDSLSLQFGSFGLSGLDNVNWSTAGKSSEPVPGSSIRSEHIPGPDTAVVTPSTERQFMKTSDSHAVEVPSASLPRTTGGSGLPGSKTSDETLRSKSRSPSSVGVRSSGMFPVLPLPPGGSFPPSYGNPYMMPAVHAYSPAIAPFDSPGDVGTPGTSNVPPPGSVPSYELTNMPPVTAGSGKYNGIPGLGDTSTLTTMPNGIGKEAVRGSGDMEKTSTLGSLAANMDPLNPPYIMPGYPSIQYPHMFTFPNAGYPPHAIPPPPGTNPFPYPPAGQVASQSTRGFGFDDGTGTILNNSRTSGGLGDSMYTPGYLSTSGSLAGPQKAANDVPHKQLPGPHPSGSLSGVGMASGIVHGLAYAEYSGSVAGATSSGLNVGGTHASWNRLSSSERTDRSTGTSVANSAPASSQHSQLYATAPAGALNGYWPQQGSYYP